MKSKLYHIKNWQELAKEARWSRKACALLCGTCVRTLQRKFLKTSGKSPKDWLRDERMKHARELTEKGCPTAYAAKALGYANAGNFIRAFHKYWGASPQAFLLRTGVYRQPCHSRPNVPLQMSQNDN